MDILAEAGTAPAGTVEADTVRAGSTAGVGAAAASAVGEGEHPANFRFHYNRCKNIYWMQLATGTVYVSYQKNCATYLLAFEICYRLFSVVDVVVSILHTFHLQVLHALRQYE